MNKQTVSKLLYICAAVLGASVFMLTALLSVSGVWNTRERRVEREDAKALEIRISSLAAEYDPVKMLFDRSFREQLEAELGVRLELVIMPESRTNNADISSIVGNGFDGIAFVTDPLLLVQAANMGALYETSYSDRQRPFFKTMEAEQMAGRYAGRQYGYVFAQDRASGKEHTLFVNSGIMERAHIADLDATPEAFYDALCKLKEEGVVPLAVYGSPADEGFAILLNLFGLGDAGGYDFVLQNDRVVYDKTTPRAKEYLEYVAKLYREGLISQDFLSMNEYSAAMQIAEGKCAMTALTDDNCRSFAIAQSSGRNLRLCRAAWPVSGQIALSRSYERLVGVISANIPDAWLAKQFFDLLSAYPIEHIQETSAGNTLETYPVFGKPIAGNEMTDPVSQCRYNIRRLNEKRMLNRSLIYPYYERIVLGSLPLSSFDQMCKNWSDDGGWILCELYTRYYHNMVKGVGVT